MLVNEGSIICTDITFAEGVIQKIAPTISHQQGYTLIHGEGLHLLPGVIDDQVHYREPGLTHKATIYTEAKAAVAGGVTSYMEMPNTVPPVFTQELLQHKYDIAARNSLANYSFYMGTSNNNADEALRTNDLKNDVCGIKIFMGSSTGGLLVDNYLTLQKLFAESEVLIATHCEDEKVINLNLANLGNTLLTPAHHPIIRNDDACYESSYVAVQLAHKYNTRLHVLHISTQRELQLFGNMLPLKQKRITAEVCVHHLHFTADDYATLGYQIKCNPAIKAAHNKPALWQALLDGRLDVIATDHAPHTIAEKGIGNPNATYNQCHAGLPLIQHGLSLMLHYHQQGQISLTQIAEKMSHNVAACFNISNRGYLREGYAADAVLVNLNQPNTITNENSLYKCAWTPLDGLTVPASITHTFINGNMVYNHGVIDETAKGERLRFLRK